MCPGAHGWNLQYDFEMPGHVYYNQIYGTIGSTSRRRFAGLPSSLVSFRVSDDEYQRARQLVSGAGGPAPIAQEFDEFGEDEDEDTYTGDGDAALARYEAVPPKLKAERKRKVEKTEAQVEEAPAPAAKRRRGPSTDRSAAIEAMYAARS